MGEISLLEVAVFLGVAVFAAPLARRLGIGSVLGYLFAGILIGPYGLGFIYSIYRVETVLHFAEFGVILLLFLIGLELRPKRLWAMRSGVFGVGSAQLGLTALLLGAAGVVLGLPIGIAILLSLTLGLSSTAFVLQLLTESGELSTRHGRTAFSVLLFQDLAAIPLIALVPVFAVGGDVAEPMNLWGATKAIGTILAVIIFGRTILHRLFPIIAASGVHEAMTAGALLTVVGVTLVMEAGGLSAGLGAFIAGALLADSDYRHELEANIAPFEGLLLGLFFTSIGMSLNLGLLLREPALLLGLVGGLIVTKSAVMFVLGRLIGLGNRPARRLALSLSQGGEFAFVTLAVAVGAGIVAQDLSEILTVGVTLSMIATPLLLWAEAKAFRDHIVAAQYDKMPNDPGFVVIAGFGRFGQIVARLLQAKGYSFTALDSSAEQVDFVRRFGNRIYYGDASRLDILQAAKTGEARAFVLAIDDVEASLKTASIVHRHFPNVPILARARNRPHAHQLMHLGATLVRRETFLSAVDLSKELLVTLGESQEAAKRAAEIFRASDIKRLNDDLVHSQDMEKLQSSARSYAAELESQFVRDAEEQRQARGDAKAQ